MDLSPHSPFSSSSSSSSSSSILLPNLTSDPSTSASNAVISPFSNSHLEAFSQFSAPSTDDRLHPSTMLPADAFTPSLISDAHSNIFESNVVMMMAASLNSPHDSHTLFLNQYHVGLASPNIWFECFNNIFHNDFGSSSVDGIATDTHIANDNNHRQPLSLYDSSSAQESAAQNFSADLPPQGELAHELLAINSAIDAEVDDRTDGGSDMEGKQVICIDLNCDNPSQYDGYEWRKYGQKAIKDKKFPRSYFRCAQQGCPVKKYVESSSEREGHVVVTYIGRHNHHQ